jgi:hypothetical protein
VADALVQTMSLQKFEHIPLLEKYFNANEAAFLMINDFIDHLEKDPLIIKLIIQFSTAEQQHFDYFIKQYLDLRQDLRSLIEQSCHEGFISKINASEIMVMLIGMVSIPTALPRLFSANFDSSSSFCEIRHNYLTSVKLLMANMLQVDGEEVVRRIENFKQTLMQDAIG